MQTGNAVLLLGVSGMAISLVGYELPSSSFPIITRVVEKDMLPSPRPTFHRFTSTLTTIAGIQHLQIN